MRVPPFEVSVGTQLKFGGRLQEVDAISDTGEVTLRCPLTKAKVTVPIMGLWKQRTQGEVAPAFEAPPKTQPRDKPKLGQFTKEQRTTIARRIAYSTVASKQYPIGPKSPRLMSIIKEVAERLGDPKPPSPHSVYRWTVRYVTSGYDSAVFMQDACATRTRTPRVAAPIKDKLRDNIQALLAQFKEATLHGLTDLALAKTAKDLGYIEFVTRSGETMLVDEYIPIAENLLRERARASKPADAAASTSTSTTGAQFT